MESRGYYIDILNKLVKRNAPIDHDELCCCRLSYEAFLADMVYLKEKGYVEELMINDKRCYQATSEGRSHVLELILDREKREKAKKDPNSILEILYQINKCWIPLDKLKPEDATEMVFADIGCLKFATVLVKDDDGHVGMANRVIQIPTGNTYLDKNIEKFDWHWSQIDFEPTHWMPMPK